MLKGRLHESRESASRESEVTRLQVHEVGKTARRPGTLSPPSSPITLSPETSVIRGACPHDCPDTCATLVEVRDGRAVGFHGDPDHPFTRGWLCAKVRPYLDRVYSPDRLQYPMRRVGAKGSGEWVRIAGMTPSARSRSGGRRSSPTRRGGDPPLFLQRHARAAAGRSGQYPSLEPDGRQRSGALDLRRRS